MHWSSKILSIAVAVSAIMFFGCEGPAGPPGTAGQNGQDGVSLEGYAPGIQCATCHSADTDTTYHVAGRKYQWAQSKHAYGGDSERNGSSCAGCHTTEGFVQRMNGQPVTEQPIPSPPGCFACHSPHLRGNFSLRNVQPVTLLSNIAGIPDATFDYGKGNLCAQCHQPRSFSPKMPANPGPTDTLTITNTRWYAHYGVQSLMLSGNGGYHFPGYTYTGNSAHTTQQTILQEGCPTCHMAEAVYPPSVGTGKAGGHTMNIGFEGEGGGESQLLTGCNQTGCHAGITTTDYNGKQTEVLANMDTLLHLMGDRGWVDTVSTSSNYGGIKLSGGKLVITPAVKAGALYNYLFIEHDLSEGVHNSNYAIELLRSSIEELRKP